MDTFVTDQMCEALQRLQRVRTHDYRGAYEACYGGISVLDPRKSTAAAELIYGRSLAMRMFQAQSRATLDLRAAR